MAQALPLAKLGGLLVKTLAKPVSKRIKHEFSRFPITQRLLIGIGQTSHQLSSRMTIWSAGYRVRSIKALEEEKALKEGADILGESIIFMVSGGIIVWEYQRSRTKEQVKQRTQREKATAERRDLQAKLHALDVRLKALEDAVQSNQQSMLELALGGGASKKYKAPPPEELVKIDDDDDDTDSENGSVGGSPESGSPSSSDGRATTRQWWKFW